MAWDQDKLEAKDIVEKGEFGEFGIEAESILDIKTPESNFNKTLVHVEGAFQHNGKNRSCFY